ncbi:MAG TPA: endonuclease/exonuclease/phosphatase family protein [Casimicrobiaceae bacterium]|nr:endonuclease/exonuclease/phosphatase family protein [Casimicrobiaceae bacterium]
MSRLTAAVPALLLAGCVVLSEPPRALIDGPDGVAVRTLPCPAAVETARAWVPGAPPAQALDPRAIRLTTWNLHKEADDGWAQDLARFAAGTDALLLQEVTLAEPVRDVLRGAKLRWVMASSFIYRDADVGVVTATRVPPVASCTQRAVEPLLRLPKSAVVSWLPLAGSAATLAVANLHAINFTLTLGEYRDQLAALGDTLAAHKGPIVLAGDFNTWNDARLAALQNLAERLRLIEIPLPEGRSRFLGKEVDHVFVRGLAVVSAAALPVTSSDHNPVTAVLRLSP